MEVMTTGIPRMHLKTGTTMKFTPKDKHLDNDEDIELPAAEKSLLQKIVRTGLVTSKHDIEVQRSDPNSPLYSVKSFELLKLNQNLLKGVFEMGYNAPSKIQQNSTTFAHGKPTKKMALWLVKQMTDQGHAVTFLSGELTVQERIIVLDQFREGKQKVLITTNVMSRGIDIEQVTIVINFDLPLTVGREPDYDTYLHRIGRTGRFGKRGIAINLLTGEEDLTIMKRIEDHFSKPIVCLNTENVDDMEKLGAEEYIFLFVVVFDFN